MLFILILILIMSGIICFGEVDAVHEFLVVAPLLAVEAEELDVRVVRVQERDEAVVCAAVQAEEGDHALVGHGRQGERGPVLLVRALLGLVLLEPPVPLEDVVAPLKLRIVNELLEKNVEFLVHLVKTLCIRPLPTFKPP